ncbi:hypothetical protein KR032_001688, partial [Drosophila birchii]
WSLHFFFPLIFVFFWLSGSVNGECCDSRLHLSFSIKHGLCGMVGALGKPDRCSIIICADGHPSVGTFCGQGSCNVFGCNCDYGCLRGNWGESFLERYSKYRIHLIESEWKSGLLRPVNT